MRYIRFIVISIKTALQNETAFRFNFFVRVLSSFLGFASGLSGVLILFANQDALNGWRFSETLAVFGVYSLMLALNNIVVSPSFNKMGGMDGEIENGNFDFSLIKPLPTQFYVSVREWSLWSLFDVAIGIATIIAACFQLDISYSIADIGLFLLSLIVALGLLYSIMLILSTVAFWYRGTYLLWIFGDILQTGRYPVGMYPGFIKLLLTWVVPVGFIVTVPAEILSQKAGLPQIVAGFMLMIGLFIASSLFFRKSLTKYTGASS